MTLILAILSVLGLEASICAPLSAQPTDGDLILTFALQSVPGPPSGGFTAYLRPGSNGPLTTISVAPTNSFDNWVRMAPDNRDLVVSRISITSTSPPNADSHLMLLDLTGRTTTIATAPSTSIDGYELDHDNQWIAAARAFGAVTPATDLIGVDHSTGKITGFASMSPARGGEGFNEIAIDRDPGSPPYALGWMTAPTTLSAKILGADRRGNVTTITATSGNPLSWLSALELHPRSGDYLAADRKLGAGDAAASRVTKGGVITSINTGTLIAGNAARIAQDDTAWIAEGRIDRTTTIVQYDFTKNAVIWTRTLSHGNGFLSGIEVYGSRVLTCNGSGKPGTSVRVSVQSQRQRAAGAGYALAASLARRPGLELPNGEWLDLAQDGLFYASALNLAPGVFQGFRGTLNAFGAATARVNIPPSIPAALGITVFVAGIIYDNRGVVQVTPSHWFVL